jgi:uncharacterized protein (TIGR01777 family)
MRRVAITGASGLIGTALRRHLEASGHRVLPISRREVPDGIRWDPYTGDLDTEKLEGVDAVVHLAGAGIADRRWSDSRKRELRESRVIPTLFLSERLAGLRQRSGVFISASAIGIYGDRGDEILSETSAIGSDFLATLGRDWEAAANPAREAGIRVVHPRFGVVLSTRGGALRRMLPPFRLGIAGRLGSGRQWMGWITLDDVVRAIEFLLDEPIAGPVIVSSPNPARNASFTKSLAHALHRPALILLPATALRALFGEMASATLLASQRVVPTTLLAHGFEFGHPELEPAIRNLLSAGR